ncbi:hypothetical protein [Winogradskyella sp. Asnod2-B02-A]|uniref:hypothetical protein n=1 Tax=Winogradskyella sp. Asnod2-B02-A TaxID=3160583 RepID=UPI003865163F
MGILSSIFGNNKKSPFKKTVSFERKESEFEINIGDEVKIWNKPNTKQLNLYAKGSAGGNGLVGTKLDSTISYHLNNTENLFIENKIVGLTKNSIDLFVKMYADKKAVQETQQNYKTEWIEKLNKKYNPKSSWELRFFSENKIGKNDFLIQTIDKSQIEEYYQKDDQTIWLTDKNGNKISAENRVRSGGTEKALRAVFSGHELEVFEFKKDHFWYYIEIGIKK